MSATPLRYNPSNPVTAGLVRARHRSGVDAVRKTIRGDRPPHHPDWAASEDDRHFLCWRREDQAHRSDLGARLAGSGLRLPRLLEREVHDDGAISLWLEDVPGRTGAALTDRDLARVAGALGRAQAALALDPPGWPWASRGFLRDFCASKHVDTALLDDDRAWEHPLIRATWPAGLRDRLLALHAARERLFAAVEGGPRVFAHLDLWANNLVVGDDVVVLDWAFAGDGALGEDLANLVAEHALDELVPPEALPGLADTLLPAYLEGLAAGGWRGDPAEVRRVFDAAGVKWHWMGALHLARAVTGEHHGYGGVAVDPHAHYRARGLGLHWLAGRALGLS